MSKARLFVDGELHLVDMDWHHRLSYAWMKWVRSDRSILISQALLPYKKAVRARLKREQKENDDE